MKNRISLLIFLMLLTACQSPVQEDSLTDQTSSAQESLTAESNTSGLTYSNEELGFSLELPANWGDYTVEKRQLQWGAYGVSDSIDFLLGGTPIFNISWYTPEQWANITAGEGPVPVKLAESDKWIYSYATAQDVGSDPALIQAKEDAESISSSFKLL